MARRLKRRTSGIAVALLLVAPVSPAGAGSVVADLADGAVLDAVAAEAPLDSRLAAALLLVEIVREALATTALDPARPLPIMRAPGAAAELGDAERVAAGELLQLFLLTGSPTAARSLAAALEPEPGALRARMARAATRLGLVATSAPRESSGHVPYPVDAPLRTTARDLARLALGLARDADFRRRLDRDGMPIADGRIIVRATAPLITTAPLIAAGAARRDAVILMGRKGSLDLLVVATGEQAAASARDAFQAALASYERVPIVSAGQPVGPEIEVPNGIIATFRAVAAEPFAVTTRVGAAPALAARLQLPARMDAPVDVRQAVGELVLEHDDEIIAVVPLIAPRTIAPRRWLDARARSGSLLGRRLLAQAAVVTLRLAPAPRLAPRRADERLEIVQIPGVVDPVVPPDPP